MARHCYIAVVCLLIKWVAVVIGGKIKSQTYSWPSVINHRSKLISGVMEACVYAVCVYAVYVYAVCVYAVCVTA